MRAVHTCRIQALIFRLQQVVPENELPSTAVVRVTLRASFRQNDVHLGWTRVTECRPVITPLFLVQRRIQLAKTIRGVSNIRHEDDQVEVVAAKVAQQRASGKQSRSLGHGLCDPR
jgi:hypothetical protein